MNKIHAILISSVRPSLTVAAHIKLYNYLVQNPLITLEVYGSEPQKISLGNIDRRLQGLFGKTFLRRFAEDYGVCRSGRWLDQYLPVTLPSKSRTVVITVAHGDACWSAQRFARKHNLPLAVFFDDWWPDICPAHEWARRIENWKFKKLYRECQLAFCICQSMQEALGHHKNSVVLYPLRKVQIPKHEGKKATNNSNRPFKLIYYGNLTDYGKMVEELINVLILKKDERICFQVRGRNPLWTNGYVDRLKREGILLDYAVKEDLDRWLASADAFLVPMSFDKEMQRRMMTSFPGKIIEMVQIKKPIIIWGPKYCSAIRWATKNASALCVTDPNPMALVDSVIRLADNPDEQNRLVRQCGIAAKSEFDPNILMAIFNENIEKIVSK